MNNTARSTLLAALLLLGAAGCGDEPTVVGNTPCGGLKTTPQTDGDVLTAIGQHVPVTLNTYCAAKATFLWEGGRVDLIYLAYGSAPTLPTTPNTLCVLGNGNGINNGSGYAWLFDAVWANNEPPLSIGVECPAIALAATGDTAFQCTAPPVSGRTHPVMTQPGFRGWLNNAPLPRQFAVCGRNLPSMVPAP